jgi:hypothetical protein
MGEEDGRGATAARAAEVVVASMPTMLWPAVMTRVAVLLGRGDGVREREVARRLEESRARMSGAATEAGIRGEITLRWRQELTAAGAGDHAATDLDAFVDAFSYLLEVTAPASGPAGGLHG